MSEEQPTAGALGDLRILDLTGPAGVYCAKLLADLGADVVRVEPPEGDRSRHTAPFYLTGGVPEQSLFHWHFNAGKRGITLDVTGAEGQALFRRLAASADAVIETFAPGYLDGLGLGFDALHALNPRLVLTSITAFGQIGPYRDYQGEELIAQAAGGLLWMCGYPARPPVMMGGYPAMHQASAQAAAATLIAIETVDATGAGQHIDVSVQAAVPLTLMASMYDYYTTGAQREPRIGDTAVTPMNGLFRCRDGYVDIRFRGRPGEWERFVRWLEAAGMAEDLVDECWRDHAFRRRPENYRHIHEVFQRFVVHLSRDEAMDAAQRIGIVAGAVYDAADLLGEPQLQARGFFVEVEHDDLGRRFVDAGAPYRLSETPWRLRSRAPLLGEHNNEIYAAELGIGESEIERLRQLHAI